MKQVWFQTQIPQYPPSMPAVCWKEGAPGLLPLLKPFCGLKEALGGPLPEAQVLPLGLGRVQPQRTRLQQLRAS